MPLIIGLLVVLLLAYLIYQFVVASKRSANTSAPGSSDRAFAYLSNGLIFSRKRGGAVEQLHSAYVIESINRRERARDRHGWKQGTSFGISAGGGMRNFQAAEQPVQATSAAFEPNGDLLYFLSDGNIGGLFRREAASGNELRVMLKQHLQLADLNPRADGELITATTQTPDGAANIVLLKRDGNDFRAVTGGDTIDVAPAWVVDAPKRLLFQSTGLARDPQGFVAARGNTSIQMLDMDSGSVSPVMEDARFDYLKPRTCPAGNLHFIRRPYEAQGYSVGSALQDTLLFPFRLIRAVFHYLNFFSLMYTRKPLTSASGPASQADLKNIILQGRRIDAENALRNEPSVQGVPSLVPRSWELVRRTRDGVETVIATSVASYDINAEGNIFYSNGRGVFVIGKDGTSRLAHSGDLVSEIVAAPG